MDKCMPRDRCLVQIIEFGNIRINNGKEYVDVFVIIVMERKKNHVEFMDSKILEMNYGHSPM